MTQSPQSYLNEDQLPLPFCPGCGHHTILKSLDQALQHLDLDPHKVVIVSDIGCAGLSDRYFSTHAFHGLHGRSATYATGIKLARPDLNVIVLIGDGGFGIGGHHLLNAARRNMGLNVFVFNNFNYGMTGGEHSVTTPPGARTSTTPVGNLEKPLDIVRSVGINGANFAARSTVFEKDLPDLMAQAIKKEGFSLIDIWELCTAYFTPYNEFSKSKLEDTLQELNFNQGLLFEVDRPEYSRVYGQTRVKDKKRSQVMVPQDLAPRFSSQLQSRVSLILAGAAGAKIATAGSLFCQGAILAGLNAAQRGDYPVTVKAGHSIAEVILSPEEIFYPAVDRPRVVMALFPPGLTKIQGKISRMTEDDLLIKYHQLPDIDTHAETWTLDYSKAGRWGRKKEYRALMALAVYLRERGIYPLEALNAALEKKPAYLEENQAALEASQDIIIN